MTRARLTWPDIVAKSQAHQDAPPVAAFDGTRSTKDASQIVIKDEHITGNVSNAAISNITFTNCTFDGTTLERVLLTNTNFQDCTFKDVLIQMSTLDNVAFINADLGVFELSYATLRNVTYRQCRARTWYIGEAAWKDCMWAQVEADTLLCNDTSFNACQFYYVTLKDSRWYGAQWLDTDLTHVTSQTQRWGDVHIFDTRLKHDSDLFGPNATMRNFTVADAPGFPAVTATLMLPNGTMPLTYFYTQDRLIARDIDATLQDGMQQVRERDFLWRSGEMNDCIHLQLTLIEAQFKNLPLERADA